MEEVKSTDTFLGWKMGADVTKDVCFTQGNSSTQPNVHPAPRDAYMHVYKKNKIKQIGQF